MTIATMATFPARRHLLVGTLKNIVDQVDILYLTLNEFTEVPEELAQFKNVVPKIPEEDYKDLGKFIYKKFIKDDDYVLTIDDDILYPDNYVEMMKQMYELIPFDKMVLGVHGMIYSDFFDGKNTSRIVYSFTKSLPSYKVVNQLGTGTVFTKGCCLPDFEYMKGSSKFVDLRMAKYLYENNIPSICVIREKDWLGQYEFEDEGIFASFTNKWPNNILHEAIEVGGLSKINLDIVKKLDVVNNALVKNI